MYRILLAGTAGPEADIAKVRVYIGSAVVEQNVAANAAFQVSVDYPTHGEVEVEHAFVDAAGNESPRLAQTVVVPDKEAPAQPSAPLTLVSVVWVA
jgi:hypothetical protein